MEAGQLAIQGVDEELALAGNDERASIANKFAPTVEAS
jgi:hypothetical protein